MVVQGAGGGGVGPHAARAAAKPNALLVEAPGGLVLAGAGAGLPCVWECASVRW